MDSILSAKGVTKTFGTFQALNGVDVDVHRGECFGLLGPNGAGKSTLIQIIYGAMSRTSGDLTVFGMDPQRKAREIKKRLGVVTQENALDEALSVEENMLLYSAFLGVPKEKRQGRVNEGLKFMNLDHKAKAPIRALSGGMKRRLVFVRALLADPELIILDEPTTGLDPSVRHLLWGKVKELKSRGASVLLTTHYMHEAEILCDRIAILHQGKVLRLASPRELIRETVPGFVGIYPYTEETEKKLKQRTGDFEIRFEETGISVRAPRIEHLIALSDQEKWTPLQLRPSNLEDVFLKLTGEGLSVHD